MIASPLGTVPARTRYRQVLRAVVRALILFGFALPVALFATWALLPVWRWVETRTGVESIGHSGPATWCYGVMYAVVLAMLAAGVRLRRRDLQT